MKKEEKIFVWIHGRRWIYIAEEVEMCEKLTKEAYDFLKSKGVNTSPLPPPDRWWGGQDIWETIRELIAVSGIILKIIWWVKTIVKILNYFWEKIKDYFKKDESQFIVFLIFRANKDDNDEIFWKRIIEELLDISLTLHEHLTQQYSFLKFWCVVRFSVFYKNFRMTLNITPKYVNQKNIKKIKNMIHSTSFKEWRRIDIIKSIRTHHLCSKIHYEWNEWWSTEGPEYKYNWFKRLQDCIDKLINKNNYF